MWHRHGPAHCDPDGSRLKQLAQVLEWYMESRKRVRPRANPDFGVFADFWSLFQGNERGYTQCTPYTVRFPRSVLVLTPCVLCVCRRPRAHARPERGVHARAALYGRVVRPCWDDRRAARHPAAVVARRARQELP